jgi:8-oxo-dGTP pyrophosphatase MutT (NUDIX family)
MHAVSGESPLNKPCWKVVDEELFPKSDNPFDNPFYGYVVTHLDLPGGGNAKYFGIDVGDCVHVVPLEEDGTTYLVQQERPNIRKRTAPKLGPLAVPTVMELPGGFAKPGIPLIESAQRELIEEVGRYATKLIPAGVILPSTGVSNEHDSIFLGLNMGAVDCREPREATEQSMRVIQGPFDEMLDMLLDSEEPISAQTVAGMVRAQRVARKLGLL